MNRPKRTGMILCSRENTGKLEESLLKQDKEPKEKLLKCTNCNKFTAKSASTLRRHVLKCKKENQLENNEPINENKPAPAKRKSNSKSPLIVKKQSRQSFACGSCTYEAVTSDDLNTHTKNEHNKTENKRDEFKCKHCSYYTYKKSYLTQHTERLHSEPLKSIKKKKNIIKRRPCTDGNNSKKTNSNNTKSKLMYTCTLCVYGTDRREYFLTHIRRTHPELRWNSKGDENKAFKCEHCSFTTDTKTFIYHHLKCVHLDLFFAANFQCDECNTMLASESGLIRHKRNMHGQKDKIFKCEQCKYKTTTDDYLKNHIRFMHNNQARKYKCELCEYAAKENRSLQSHIKKIHVNPKRVTKKIDFWRIFENKKPSYSSNSNIDLNRQIQPKHRKIKYKCTLCPFKTKRQEYFSRHLNKSHPEIRRDLKSIEKKAFNCEHCYYSTDDKNNIYHHLKCYHLCLFTKPVFLYCEKCNYSTVLDRNLKLHVERMHNDNNEQIFECYICEYTSKKKTCYQKHLSNHRTKGDITNTAKPVKFKCTLCNGILSSSWGLKMHITAKHGNKEKIFKCNDCSYSTHCKYYLRSHIRKHLTDNSDEIKRFKCTMCLYNASNDRYLKKHIETKHNNTDNKGVGTKPFKCQKCNFESSVKSKLKAHSIYMHQDKNFLYQCTLCAYKTDNLRYFNQHTSRIHPELRKSNETKKFTCEHCSYSTDTKNGIYKHMKRCHLISFSCVKCNFITTSNLKLDFHMKTAHTEKELSLRYKCDLCTYSTNVKGYIRDHIRKRHLKEEMHCTLCTYTTTQEIYLKNHIKCMHNDNNIKCFQCKQCSFITTTAKYLCAHEKTMHNDTIIEPVPCNQCTYKTTKVKYLKEHMKNVHSGKKQVQCKQCTFRTSTELLLRKHEKDTHSGKTIKSIQCKLCTFTTVSAKRFKQHEKIMHSGKNIKPIHCKKCNFTTTTERYLRKHIKNMHGNRTPVQCKQCSFATTTESHLKKHLKLVHNDENIQLVYCKQCTFTTNNESYLKKHVKNKHEESTKVFNCTLCTYSSKNTVCYRQHLRDHHENAFKCTQCTFITDSKNNLDHHIKYMHSQQVINKCTECPYISNNIQCLQQHQKNVHPEKYLLKCKICSFTTTAETNLNQHVLKMHKNEGFKCALCTFNGLRRKSYLLHLTKHQEIARNKTNCGNKAFNCYHCIYSTDVKQNMILHLKCYHSELFEKLNVKEKNKPFNCNQCSASFTLKKSLMDHTLNLHAENQATYTCSLCSYNSTVLNYFNRHVKRNHSQVMKSDEKEIKNYKCEHCSFSTDLKENIFHHLKCAHPNLFVKTIIKCIHCDYRSTVYDLKKHMGKVHKIFKCFICSCNFTGNLNYQEHLKSVHREYFLFKCNDCSYTNDNKNNLRKHIVFVHIRNRPRVGDTYKCEKCSYSSNVRINFLEHMKRHHPNSEILVCNKCTYSTFKFGLWERHQSYHKRKEEKKANKVRKIRRIRSLQCDYCSFSTTRHMALDRHIKSAHTIKYTCANCNKKFLTKAKLQIHIIKLHLLKEISKICKEKKRKVRKYTRNIHNCDQCNFIAYSKKGILNHIENAHKIDNINPPVESEQASENYSIECENAILSIQSVQCSLCEFNSDDNNMKKHIQNMHTSNNFIRHNSEDSAMLLANITSPDFCQFSEDFLSEDFRCDCVGEHVCIPANIEEIIPNNNQVTIIQENINPIEVAVVSNYVEVQPNDSNSIMDDSGQLIICDDTLEQHNSPVILDVVNTVDSSDNIETQDENDDSSDSDSDSDQSDDSDSSSSDSDSDQSESDDQNKNSDSEQSEIEEKDSDNEGVKGVPVDNNSQSEDEESDDEHVLDNDNEEKDTDSDNDSVKDVPADNVSDNNSQSEDEKSDNEHELDDDNEEKDINSDSESVKDLPVESNVDTDLDNNNQSESGEEHESDDDKNALVVNNNDSIKSNALINPENSCSVLQVSHIKVESNSPNEKVSADISNTETIDVNSSNNYDLSLNSSMSDNSMLNLENKMKALVGEDIQTFQYKCEFCNFKTNFEMKLAKHLRGFHRILRKFSVVTID